MRTTKFTSVFVTTAVCGALVAGTVGPAVAATSTETRVAAAHQRFGTVDRLGETLSAFTEIAAEARSDHPDAAKLETLRQRLRVSGDGLVASAATTPVSPGADAAVTDAVAELKAALDKLVADAGKLLERVLANDLKGAQEALAAAVADVKDLLLKVPALLKTLPGLPTLPTTTVPVRGETTEPTAARADGAGPVAATDVVADLKAALDKLVADITKLLDDVKKLDVAAATADATAVLAGLKDLPGKAVAVLTGGVALPV
ncbi:hypothetical protein [Embleya sp. NPDC001921]